MVCPHTIGLNCLYFILPFLFAPPREHKHARAHGITKHAAWLASNHAYLYIGLILFLWVL